MRYAKRRADFAKAAPGTGLVMHHRRAANHFEVGDSGKAREDFVLHAISEELVCLLFTQIFKWEHGDTFF